MLGINTLKQLISQNTPRSGGIATPLTVNKTIIITYTD